MLVTLPVVTVISPENEAAAEVGMVGRIIGMVSSGEVSKRLKVVVEETQVVTNVVCGGGSPAGVVIVRVVNVSRVVKVNRVMVLACAKQRVIVDDP